MLALDPSRAPALSPLLLFVAMAAHPAPARAADLAGAKDHPLIKRFAGSEIVGYQVKRFDTYELQTSTFKEYDLSAHKRLYVRPPLKLEGTITRLWYEAAGETSSTELARNYLNELKARDFEILYDSEHDPAATSWVNYLASFNGDGRPTSRSSYIFFSAPAGTIHSLSARRGDTYVSVITVEWGADDSTFRSRRGAYASVDVIETGTMKQSMVVVSADDMSKALASAGRVALYGIYFDTDKAEILPRSRPALEQIVRLLKQEPALKLRVVGHTDNVGGLDANLALSRRRAEAVLDALTREHGIEPRRLSAHGVASLAPAATDATEEGRGRNRRVELVSW
jgi:outer membrane protein OmpA-like peptidoglycan-associated protein